MDVIFVTIKKYQVALMWEIYVSPLNMILGIPGNILTMMVMTKKHNRCRPCCWLMLMLAIADLGYITTGSYYYIKHELLHIKTWTLVECKVVGTFLNFFSISSCYILALFTVNRFIAVCYPLLSKGFDTLHKARICSVSVIIMSLIFCIPINWTLEYVPVIGCLHFSKPGLFTKIYSVLYILIGPVFPFCILLILNLAIIYSLNRRREGFSKYGTEATSQNIANVSSSSQMTRMLLFVTFTFLILTFPQCMRVLVFSFVDPISVFPIFYLYFAISSRMYATNMAINFYLYCISGRQFRNDVKYLFKRLK